MINRVSVFLFRSVWSGKKAQSHLHAYKCLVVGGSFVEKTLALLLNYFCIFIKIKRPHVCGSILNSLLIATGLLA